MSKKIPQLTAEEIQTLFQIEEFLESEIYSTGEPYVDDEILKNVSSIIKKVQELELILYF
jgi:DNA-binding GntR family transcriptional regulator